VKGLFHQLNCSCSVQTPDVDEVWLRGVSCNTGGCDRTGSRGLFELVIVDPVGV